MPSGAMPRHLLAAAGLSLSLVPAAASAYDLCTDATLVYGSRPDQEAVVEIGGVPYVLTLRFGTGRICGTEAHAAGAIRAKAGLHGHWVSCDGEVAVGATGTNQVTIRIVVQYTADAMPRPYTVSTCSKE